MENLRRSPFIACETVDGRGTCHDASTAEDVFPGVDVPEDDVGVWSLKVLADIVCGLKTSSTDFVKLYPGERNCLV